MSGFPIRGSVALVTGAAGGIGRAVALSLARRGADLALLDRRAEALAMVGAEVEALGRRASLHAVDITDAAAVEAAPEAAAGAHGRLDILVNNAGLALTGRFEQLSMADIDAVLDVNLRGPMRLTLACLPQLRAAPEARIVNISSLYGLVAPPGQTAYAASKFALRAFSEALRHELSGSRIGVTTILPGGVATDIATAARRGEGVSEEESAAAIRLARRLLTMRPERAGEIIARGVERRRARLLVGRDAWLLATLERLFPVNHMAFLAWFAGGFDHPAAKGEADADRREAP